MTFIICIAGDQIMARRRRRRPPGGHTTAAGSGGRRAPFSTDTDSHTHTARSLACPLLTLSSARPFSNGIFRYDGAPCGRPLLPCSDRSAGQRNQPSHSTVLARPVRLFVCVSAASFPCARPLLPSSDRSAGQRNQPSHSTVLARPVCPFVCVSAASFPCRFLHLSLNFLLASTYCTRAHTLSLDSFCRPTSSKSSSPAGLFPLVYAYVVDCAPASPYAYSSSTHRFPDERTPIEATPLSATSAELVLGLGLGLGLGSHSSSQQRRKPLRHLGLSRGDWGCAFRHTCLVEIRLY